MSGTYGSYWQGRILIQNLGQGVQTQQTLWIALCSQTCWTAGGSSIMEPTGGGYARFGIATNSLFNAVTPGAVGPSSGAVATNTATMTISAGTTSNWGDIGWIAVMNTTTIGDGDCLAWCTAAATRTINTGDQVLIAAGSLTIQVGP